MHTELADWRTLPDDIDFMAGNWGYACGGIGARDDQWSINFVDTDLTETRYVLPDFISMMINSLHANGRKEAQRDIRRALGI